MRLFECGESIDVLSKCREPFSRVMLPFYHFTAELVGSSSSPGQNAERHAAHIYIDDVWFANHCGAGAARSE
jgi:hypothetical protein